MDTFIRATTLISPITLPILQSITVLPTLERMQPEDEAEEEGEEAVIKDSMGTLLFQVLHGKEEVTLSHTVTLTDMQAVTTQVLVPRMDLMDPTGGVDIWDKRMKIKMPDRRNPGSLVMNRGEKSSAGREVI